MDDNQRTSVTLPDDVAAMLEERVASGEYATAGEAIRDALNALRFLDAEREDWLRGEVARSYDNYAADPTTVIPADDIMDRVRASYDARRR